MLKGWRSLCNRSDLQGAFRHDQRVHFPFGLTNHSSAAHGSLWLLHHADWGCHCDSTSWSFWMAGPTHFLWIGTGVMYILREFYYLACHVQHATAPPLNTLQPGSGGEALAHFWYFESGPSVASAGCWHERQAAWLQMLGTLDQICQNTTNTTNKHSGKNICCRGKAGDVLYLEQADPFRQTFDACGWFDVYRCVFVSYLQVGPLLLDELLKPGDVVYLPRGFPHVAGHFGWRFAWCGRCVHFAAMLKIRQLSLFGFCWGY